MPREGLYDRYRPSKSSPPKFESYEMRVQGKIRKQYKDRTVKTEHGARGQVDRTERSANTVHGDRAAWQAKPAVDNITPRTWYPGTIYRKPGISDDRNHEINRDNRGLMRRLRDIYSGDGKRHGGEESYIYRGTTPTSERAASRSRSRTRSRYEKYGRSRSRSLSATRRKEEARVIIQENARLSRRLTRIKPTISRERSLNGYLDHCSRGARVSRMNQKKYQREIRDISDVLPNPPKPRKLKPLRFLNADGSERKGDY